MKYIYTILIPLFFAGCGGDFSNFTTENENTDTKYLDTIIEIDKSAKNDIIDKINSIRAEGRMCGDKYFDAVAPLSWNDNLYNAAYEHSWDMKESKKFNHQGSGTLSDKTAQDNNLNRGSYFYERILHNGYKYINSGENIYYSSYSSSASRAIDAWVESPSHCENIMDSDFSEVAVSVVRADDGASYWTQDFGRR